MATDISTPSFTGLPDLAAARTGGKAIATNDDFFAPMANLLKAEPAVFIPGKFTAKGKWMDGWESRRRRVPGHDWCVVQLGMRGRICGVNIDTHHFTGNFPSHASLEALDTSKPIAKKALGANGAPWVTLLGRVPLQGNSDNFFAIDDPRAWTHVRLNIIPDGGVARLRVHGEVVVDWKHVAPKGRVVDLARIEHGGLVMAVTDMHFGAKDNLLMPGRAKNMGDGWETRRRRGPGYDWAIVRLGAPAMIKEIEIDTNHFKGNFPDSASIDGALAPGATAEQLATASWWPVLEQTKLKANYRHFFTKELRSLGAVSHLRLNIFPDGGVSRLRVHGTLAPA